MTNRKVPLLCSAASLVAILFAISLLSLSAKGEQSESPTVSAPNTSYPVIYAGDTITLSSAFESIRFFSPVFGADRGVVNPTLPEIGAETELLFLSPGEYYLEFDEERALRVVVLDRAEPIRDSVVRIFDFFVANLIVTRGHDKKYSSDPDGYTTRWFQSRDPGMLLCGPTQALFQKVIHDRFALPVRQVTFTGTYLENGKVRYGTHNVPEVYLPDLRKWVFFDVNHGFLVKWLDALEISSKVRKKAGIGRALTPAEWSSISWDQHFQVSPFSVVDFQNTEDTFRSGLLTGRELRDEWYRMSVYLVGGPSYWGNARSNLPDDFDLYYATLHDDSLLVESSLRWLSNWNLKGRVVKADEIRRMLSEAYKDTLLQQAWLGRISEQQKKALIETRSQNRHENR